MAVDSPTSRPPISVYAILGGSTVADVLLWRRRRLSAAVLVSVTAAWLLFDLAGYSILSVLANALLLLVVILFFWAKSASLLNRPLPPLPNLELSDQVVEKFSDEVLVWLNLGLGIAHDIAIKHDRKLFLQVIISLWAISYVGSIFNFLTLVYIGIVTTLTIPVLFDKYQDHIDKNFSCVRDLALKQCDSILKRNGTAEKEKKVE